MFGRSSFPLTATYERVLAGNVPSIRMHIVSRGQRQYTFSTSCESLGELHSLVQVFLVKGQP
jgi:hypothetical protein